MWADSREGGKAGRALRDSCKDQLEGKYMCFAPSLMQENLPDGYWDDPRPESQEQQSKTFSHVGLLFRGRFLCR